MLYHLNWLHCSPKCTNSLNTFSPWKTSFINIHTITHLLMRFHVGSFLSICCIIAFFSIFFFHCKLGSTVHYVQKKEITITRYMYMLWMSIPQFHSLNFQFVWLRWCFVLFLLFSGARMLNVILRLLQVVWNVHLLFFISF